MEDETVKVKKTLDHYDLIIFDLDGTLVDSMWIWEEIDKVYLEERGIAFPEDLQKQIEGMTISDVAHYFRNRFQIDESPEEMQKTWQDMAHEFYKSKVKSKPGVIELLNGISEKGKMISLGTSNFRLLAELVLESNEMIHYFDMIKTAEEVGKGKPHPDLFLHIAETLGVSPSRTLVFEDTNCGVMAANNANMDVYSVYDLSSKENEAEIKEKSIDMIYDYHEFNDKFLA